MCNKQNTKKNYVSLTEIWNNIQTSTLYIVVYTQEDIFVDVWNIFEFRGSLVESFLQCEA